MSYTELQVTSNFSFLRGGSHPEELVEQAAVYGYARLAITDRNTLAGIVRAHVAAKDKGISIIPAARLDLQNGPSLLAYPTDKHAYGRLSALLTIGNLRTEKGKCLLYRKDVYEHAEGILFVVIPPSALNRKFDYEDSFKKMLAEYSQQLDGRLHLAVSRSYSGDDQKKVFRLSQLSALFKVPLVATNDVHYHVPDRRELQDVLTCIREKCTIETAGFRLHENAERHLKPVEEMERLFRQYPDALARSMEIAAACRFTLDDLQYEYPDEVTGGMPAQQRLEQLAWEGARERYGHAIPESIEISIQRELAFIEEMNYAPYFLTVEDIVKEARRRKILCQGRGSAANSTVCYCLGITSVDPTKFELLFERFISSARNEPPDIDLDLEHERREEIMQYIYDKYGRDRAAIVATVTQQWQKGAIRDVGKAMGLSLDVIGRLSGMIWSYTDEWWNPDQIRELGLNPEDEHLRKVLELTRLMMGFPRQLGQHTGGFVITRGKLTDLCPVLNARMEKRTNIEWDKNDIDALGFMKVDVLALGMLTCIRKAFDLCKTHYNLDLTLANIPQDDPKVYEMISCADTIGVFQIESRAQQSMLPRLKPENFYDLVIEVAIVRPGPIVGNMVHPFLRRRNGEEPVQYPSRDLEKILSRTLGVPLFQEQVMKIAMVAAGFTAAEADELRRSMATFKISTHGKVNKFEQRLIDGMLKNGYSRTYAQQIFEQLKGFGSYGFPESHAASFALLVYVSSWLKCYYPEVFACALLNSMPMGFYRPAQIIYDARRHRVVVRPVDVNCSAWDNILEEKVGPYHALRLGFQQIKGLRKEDMERLIAARKAHFTAIQQIRDAGVPVAALQKLAAADAFGSMGLDRRAALWEVAALEDRPVGIFRGQPSDSAHEAPVQLPAMTEPEHVVQDYSSVTLSLKGHPLKFAREKLQMLHARSSGELESIADGEQIKVAGIVQVRQRPGTAKGVCFITLEDEAGFINLVVFQKIFEKYRKEILQSTLLMVEGKLQREGSVVHIIVERCFNLNQFLRREMSRKPVAERSENCQQSPALSPSFKKGNDSGQQMDIFGEPRNFH